MSLVSLAALLVASAGVQGRPAGDDGRSTLQASTLVTQRIENGRRVCIYRSTINRVEPPDRQHEQNARRDLRPRRLVALSERCPQQDPGQDSARSRAIPSMATLTGESIDGNERVCRYRYLQRRYSRSISLAQRCPLTPHFAR